VFLRKTKQDFSTRVAATPPLAPAFRFKRTTVAVPHFTSFVMFATHHQNLTVLVSHMRMMHGFSFRCRSTRTWGWICWIRSSSDAAEAWWDAGGIFACPDTDSFSARFCSKL
jgi:hypothetical protein